MTSGEQAATLPTEEEGKTACTKVLTWVIISVLWLSRARGKRCYLRVSYGFPLSLRKQEQVVELCKPPKVKENLQPIFPVHLSACFCPSLKPLQVRQILAPCLHHKSWSFELSKPRSGLLPITGCTLTSRSPKTQRGFLSWHFSGLSFHPHTGTSRAVWPMQIYSRCLLLPVQCQQSSAASQARAGDMRGRAQPNGLFFKNDRKLH